MIFVLNLKVYVLYISVSQISLSNCISLLELLFKINNSVWIVLQSEALKNQLY